MEKAAVIAVFVDIFGIVAMFHEYLLNKKKSPEFLKVTNTWTYICAKYCAQTRKILVISNKLTFFGHLK